MSKAEARAIVTITLEIPVDGGSWGADCTLGQVHDQALQSVRHYLQKAQEGDRVIKGPAFPPGTRIVGEPVVAKVITGAGGGA